MAHLMSGERYMKKFEESCPGRSCGMIVGILTGCFSFFILVLNYSSDATVYF